VARRVPRSDADLDGLPGLGPVARERYGAAMLTVVAGAITADERSADAGDDAGDEGPADLGRRAARLATREG
jgi:hypothetical protein